MGAKMMYRFGLLITFLLLASSALGDAVCVPNTLISQVDYTTCIFDAADTVTQAGTTTYTNSSGTVIPLGAIANTKRCDYAWNGSTYVAKGWLVERAAQNVLLQSSTITTAPWSSTGSAVYNHATTAPDGTTAYSILTTSAGTNGKYQGFTSSAGQIYIWGVRVKKVSGTNPIIQIGNGATDSYINTGGYPIAGGSQRGTAFFNLDTLAFTSRDNGVLYSDYISLGGGWYYVFVVAGTTISSTTYAYNIVTTAASEIAFWGNEVVPAQITNNSVSFPYPTGYSSAHIPTTTVAISRVADVPSNANWASYALVVEMEDEQTMVISRKYYSVGTWTAPVGNWYRRICLYQPGVSEGYLKTQLTVGASCT